MYPIMKPYKQFDRIISIDRNATETPIIRSKLAPEQLEFTNHPSIDTPYKLLRREAEIRGSLEAYGFREYSADGLRGAKWVWSTRSQILTRVHNFANGLRNIGLNEFDVFGILTIPREEFCIAHYACGYQRFSLVCLNETLSTQITSYILEHSEVKALCVHETLLYRISDCFKEKPQLKNQIKAIIVLDSRPIETHLSKQKDRSLDSFTHTFTEIEQIGLKNPFNPNLALTTDLDLLMYTSGTTGTPKGVMLSHKAVLAPGFSLEQTMPVGSSEDPTKIVHYLFLPFSHVFAVVMEITAMFVGARTGLLTDSIKEIARDLETLQPSVMAAVPRVLTRIYDGITRILEQKNVIVRGIFKAATSWKYFWRMQGYSTPITDHTVFRSIFSRLGYNFNILLSAGAPLSPEVSEFFNTIVCNVYHGYGLTECMGLGVRTENGDHLTCCDWLNPFLANEIKLINVPSLEYFVTSDQPRGEICIRGQAIFDGYFKDKEATKEALDDDGWFHTGDIGEMDRNGRIKIVDRIKNIFKLSQGEYVCAEVIEGILSKSVYILDIFVYGESDKNFAIALIVPNQEEIIRYIKQKNLSMSTDMESICKSNIIIDLICEEIKSIAQKNKLRGFEIPKSFALCSTPFGEFDDLVSPSLKIKRKQLVQVFHNQIVGLYRNPPMIASTTKREAATKQE